MDRTHPQVVRFAATLAAMDDDTLAAMANKGLVRRARKDIEKTPPTLIEADDQSVSLSIEGVVARLANPLSQSSCSCTSGICRHILGSVIFLRDSRAALAATVADVAAPSDSQNAEPNPSAAPSLADQLLSLDDQAMQKWAPRPMIKRAAVVLSRGYEVEEAPIILVRLPSQNVTVRLLGASPDAIICSCHAPGPCEHKVAAILAYQAHKSGRAALVPQAVLQASAGAPRSREEVRAAVAELMREMVALGLSRVSAVTEQRLRTLATSAHGVDLPRLERMLKATSDEVRLALTRDAQASSATLLAMTARIAALCAALDQPTQSLVGEHRSVYMPVSGVIELIGLGARRWRTRSGYHGVTVFFWEPSASRWTAWNDARPLGAQGFDPVTRFEEDGPWPGCGNPRQAAMNKWRLSGAHRNGAGRITSRANTRGIASGRSVLEEGPLLRDFAALAEVAKQAFAPGLTDHRDHADLVLLAPQRWFDPQYDPITQEVTRLVSDAGNRTIPLQLRHSPETDEGLTTLQRIDGATVRAVLGSLRITGRGPVIEPITLWTDSRPFHLTLDGAPPRSAREPVSVSQVEEEPGEIEADTDDEPVVQEIASPVGLFLAQVEGILLALAEGGVEVMRDVSPLRDAARECRALGLAECGKALSSLSEQLEQFRKSIERDAMRPAGQLLRAAYLVRLAAECATVCAAISA